MNRLTTDLWFAPKTFIIVASVAGALLIGYGIFFYNVIPTMPEAKRPFGIVVAYFSASAPLAVFTFFYVQWIMKYYVYYRLVHLLDSWSRTMKTKQWISKGTLYAIYKRGRLYTVTIDSPEGITSVITIGDRKYNGHTKPSGKFDPPDNQPILEHFQEFTKWERSYGVVTPSMSLRKLSKVLKPALRQ